MKNNRHLTTIFFRVTMLVAILLQSSSVPAQAQPEALLTFNPFLAGLAELANLKYGGLVQDYDNNNNNRKHLGFISVDIASLAGIDFEGVNADLMQENATLYIDLDDYYSALHPDVNLSQEGRGTSDLDQWVMFCPTGSETKWREIN